MPAIKDATQDTVKLLCGIEEIRVEGKVRVSFPPSVARPAGGVEQPFIVTNNAKRYEPDWTRDARHLVNKQFIDAVVDTIIKNAWVRMKFIPYINMIANLLP